MAPNGKQPASPARQDASAKRSDAKQQTTEHIPNNSYRAIYVGSGAEVNLAGYPS